MEEIWTRSFGAESWATVQGSYYHKFMKQVLIQLKDQGALDRILRKWQPPEADCEPLRRSGQSMKFEKLISLFFIVIFGIFLAAITFILENVYFNLMNSNYADSPPISNNDELILKLISTLKDVNVRLDANLRVDISFIEMISNIYNDMISRYGSNCKDLSGGSRVSSIPVQTQSKF